MDSLIKRIVAKRRKLDRQSPWPETVKTGLWAWLRVDLTYHY